VPYWGGYDTELNPCPLLDDTLDRNKLFGDAADRLFPEAVHGFTASSDSSLQINILGTDSPLVVNGFYFEKLSAVGQSLTRYPADIAAIFESWEGFSLKNSQLNCEASAIVRQSSASPTFTAKCLGRDSSTLKFKDKCFLDSA
jgi:hypothetical protein